MPSLSPIHTTPAIRFKYLNWIAIDPLPFDHPNLQLPYPATADDDRGG